MIWAVIFQWKLIDNWFCHDKRFWLLILSRYHNLYTTILKRGYIRENGGLADALRGKAVKKILADCALAVQMGVICDAPRLCNPILLLLLFKLLFHAVYYQIWAEEYILLLHFRLCAYITFLTLQSCSHFSMQMLYAADQWHILLPCFSKKRRYRIVLSLSAHIITFNPKDNFNYISGRITCPKACENMWKAEGQQKDGQELPYRQPAQATAPSTLI